MDTRIQLIARLVAGIAVATTAAGMPATAAAAPVVTHTRSCGGIEYGIRAQREKVSLPGLTAPRLYYDGRDPDTLLDDTYARWSGRNDVIVSPFPGPDSSQLRPVAEQLGVICNEGQPGVLVRRLHWGDIEPGSRRRDYEFADYAADHVLTADAEYSEATGDGEWLANGEFAILTGARGRSGRGRNTLVVEEMFSFDVVIDPTLDVRLPEVDGFHDGDPPRPTGRADFGDGDTTEYVLDELMVLVPDDATLQAILGRWDAELVDLSPPDREGVSGALIRIDPAVLAEVDTSTLAESLLLIEPNHRGTLALSSDRLAQLFAVAVAEIGQHGTVVAPNGLLRADSITTGSTTEGPIPISIIEFEPDAFKWDFMRGDGGSRTGAGWAWQVMDATVGFDEKVKLMVVDGGFVSSADYPAGTIIRQTEWGTPNPIVCSNGGACPWHGSASAMTAAAKVDNGFGTAGPAGPVADLIVVGIFLDSYKTQRRTRDMVNEYRPAIVNMSFSRACFAFRDTTEAIYDIYLKEMFQLGALVFASSGNNGINVDAMSGGDESRTVLPCESRYVVCVGGMTGGGAHAVSAAYGTHQGNRTVEIAGPNCTWGRVDDSDLFNVAMKQVCGTSEASPFVAGVAALVKSINPSLSASEVRDLLYDTANTGLPFVLPVSGGYDRRVNAYEAVVAALGIELTPPTLTILQPDPGTEVASESSLDVRAVAEDTFDRNLTIRWESDKDGFLTTTASGVSAPVFLSPGAHVLSATATDFRGVSTDKSVAVQVGFQTQVTILTPQPGAQVYVGQSMAFSASSFDPDTISPLPDNKIAWVVRKNNVDVWGDSGHFVMALGNVFSAGTYHVEVYAFDDDGTTTDTSHFTVLPVPPGESLPQAHITVPATNIELGAYNGHPVDVSFEGYGFDQDDGGILSGTRLRWTAMSQFGTKKTLCLGTHVPNQGDGGIVLPQDCSAFTTQLGLDQSETITTWLITLEAYDSSGLVGIRQRTVEITYFTG